MAYKIFSEAKNSVLESPPEINQKCQELSGIPASLEGKLILTSVLAYDPESPR